MLALAVAPCAAAAEAAPAARGAGFESALACPLLADEAPPRLMLAQRTITRSWGPSDDSVYVVIPVPEWRSEGGALALSALLPGAGELYVGQRSGWLFLLAEAGGWAAHFYLARTADRRREEAFAYAGDPRDPSSVWSLERWSAVTGEDPDALERLFAGDPGGFYSAIRDPRYAAGFANDDSRSVFESLQASGDRRRRLARRAIAALALNHLVSAFDAFRAARIHNLPIQRNLELRLGPLIGDGRTGVVATLEGSF